VHNTLLVILPGLFFVTAGMNLDLKGSPFIALALDLDPQQIAQARARGIEVAFVNADRPDILQAAGLARSRTQEGHEALSTG